jgi:pimeloyl-ACP methyl ester carboxylesterase
MRQSVRSGVARAGLIVGGGAALVGGLALANRALLLDDLPPTLPGAMHDWSWRGWRVRYTTLGAGSPIVLVHSVHAAASSFEMRNIFEPLSQHNTVYAADLLGFGKSERPAVPYSAPLYVDLLAEFVADVVRQPATLVGSSLGAAYAVGVARARPDLVERLVLISPTGTTRSTIGGRAFGRLLAAPLVGTAAFNVLVSRASIQSYLRRAYADPSSVDDPVVDQHWATAHQPNARLAPTAFVSGKLDQPLTQTDRPIDAPILVVRGSVPGLGAQASDAELHNLGPNVTIETLDGDGQVPHDEAADRVLATLESWLQRPGRP